MSLRPLFVVAGCWKRFRHRRSHSVILSLDIRQFINIISASRLFAKNGYSVALIARRQDPLTTLADEINKAGGDAAPFAVPSYTQKDFTNVFSDIESRFPKSDFVLRSALLNFGSGIWKPFLDLTTEEVQQSLEDGVVSAFAFSREVILKLKENKIDTNTGKRGTLIFTGATASLRGNVTTSAFAAAKFGSRALSQSLAKEFGKENIHVAHAIIDGVIETGNTRAHDGDGPVHLNPDSIAKSYLALANQDCSAMTWELDLRPSQEKW